MVASLLLMRSINRIRVISADGAFVSTYAGSGTATQTNEPQALQAALDIDLSATAKNDACAGWTPLFH